MPLTELNDPTNPDIHYDPAFFQPDDLTDLLSPADPGAGEDAPDLPDALIQVFEQGGTRQEATRAMKQAFDAGVLDAEDPLTERDAFFEQLAAEVAHHPDPAKCDPALAQANLEAVQLFNVVIDDAAETIVVEAEGAVILRMPLTGKDNGKEFAKLVLFVQTVLDIIALGFAFLSVQMERGKKWAKTVSNKLGKAKKWFQKAKSAFGKFNKFYKAYEDIKKNNAKATKLQIFEKIGGAFGKAFLGFFGDVLKQSLKIVKELLKVIFGTWGDVIRFLVRIGIAIAEWLGFALTQLGVVVVNAIIAASYVLDDLIKWKQMSTP